MRSFQPLPSIAEESDAFELEVKELLPGEENQEFIKGLIEWSECEDMVFEICEAKIQIWQEDQFRNYATNLETAAYAEYNEIPKILTETLAEYGPNHEAIKGFTEKQKSSRKAAVFRVIAAFKHTDTTLNLEGLDLGSLPPEDVMGKLPWLKELIISQNQIKDISPIKGLRELKSLDTSNNYITNFHPISDLPLRSLNTYGNPIREESLPPLLQKINCITKLETSLLGYDCFKDLVIFNIDNGGTLTFNDKRLGEASKEIPKDYASMSMRWSGKYGLRELFIGIGVKLAKPTISPRTPSTATQLLQNSTLHQIK